MRFTLVLAAFLALRLAGGGVVSVAYAGSLVRVMEGPVKTELASQAGLQFSGEAKGSRALANLIAAGLRNPDVFISADASLVRRLQAEHLVASSSEFGSARMVVAFSERSLHRALFQRVLRGRISVLQALATSGVSVGSTDPQLDPKGARTLRTLALLGKHFHNPALARAIAQKLERFPEEDLAVRVESGEVDAGFFYSTEIPGRNLESIELPADSNLSGQIAYTLAVMRNAPHPAAARTFARWLLAGPGKTLLEQAGVHYFAHT